MDKASKNEKKDNKTFGIKFIDTYLEKRAIAKYNHDPMDEFTRFLMMSFAAILMALGTHFFKYPNSFVIGGVEGMSIIISTFLPLARSSWLRPSQTGRPLLRILQPNPRLLGQKIWNS